MKKRIFGVLLSISLLFSFTTSAFATTPSSDTLNYTIVEDDMLDSTIAPFSTSTHVVPVSEIQSLLDERTSAIINKDQETYDEITKTLRDYGVKEISYEKLPSLLGEDSIPSTMSTLDHTSTTKNSVFEYYYTTYKYNGTTYDIMRVLASPNMKTSGDTILYHSNVLTLHNAKSATLIAMDVLGIGIKSLIGKSEGAAILLTLLDVVDTIHSGLSTFSKVSNVTANYQWNLAEDCSWIYVSKKGQENYKISGRYHKASMGVLVGVPKLVVNNMDSTAYIQSINRQVKAKPINYDSTYQAVRAFASGAGVYESSITALPVTGIEGKTVTSARLSNPSHPLYAQ